MADFTNYAATYLHQTGTEKLVHVSSHCIPFLWSRVRAYTDVSYHRSCSACPQLADYLKSLHAPSSVQPLIERGAEAARDCGLFLQQQDPAKTGLAVAGAAGEQLHQLPHGSSSRTCTQLLVWRSRELLLDRVHRPRALRCLVWPHSHCKRSLWTRLAQAPCERTRAPLSHKHSTFKCFLSRLFLRGIVRCSGCDDTVRQLLRGASWQRQQI
jgi:hypothetical protein